MNDHMKIHIERIGIALVQSATHAAQWIFREQREVDHGIDAHIESIIDGRVSGRLIALQIKTGPSYFEEETDAGFVFRGDHKHAEYWLEHSLPVLLLLVDPPAQRILWVQVTSENVTSTGKAWKIIVPHTNSFDTGALTKLGEVAVNLRISRPYSRLQLSDVSHPGAKRYSADILLNADLPKDYVRSLTSEITKQIRLETWMRNPRLEARFGKQPADVVSLFIYRTVEDSKHANWLCRTQWFSPGLAEGFRPASIVAGGAAGEMQIEWSRSRHQMESLTLAHELSKGEAVIAIRESSLRAIKHLTENRQLLESFAKKPTPLHPAISRLAREATVAREVFSRSREIGVPPYELADLMNAFNSVLASYDNAFMLFLDPLDGQASADRAGFLVSDYLRMFDSDLSVFLGDARRLGVDICPKLHLLETSVVPTEAVKRATHFLQLPTK